MHSELVDIEREVGSMTRAEHAGSLPSRPGLPGVSLLVCGEVYRVLSREWHVACLCHACQWSWYDVRGQGYLSPLHSHAYHSSTHEIENGYEKRIYF